MSFQRSTALLALTGWLSVDQRRPLNKHLDALLALFSDTNMREDIELVSVTVGSWPGYGLRPGSAGRDNDAVDALSDGNPQTIRPSTK